jgi:serine-type D-Ala-D-Ala carboxypeptidase
MDEGPANGPAAAVRLVEAAVEGGIVSAAVLAVGRGATDEGDLSVFGRTRLDTEGSPVTADTLFDLASLTKVVATTPAVLRLADAGELGLDDPVARYLPAYSDGAKAEVTLRHLLTHSSGLPPHRAFDEVPGSVEQRLAAVAEEPLAAAPGTRVVYSDLGFILLGAVVAQAAGAGLDRAARDLVFDPLGMKSTGYLPSAAPERFAATEIRPETGAPVIGTVHDENAAALGGVAGHAGVFGTVGDLVRYLRSGWLDQDCTFLSERGRTAALACGTEGLDGRRGLGWTLAGDRWDHMTAAWPRTRAGHTGFTGTSLAFDPVSGLWTVLLTNAVHLGRDHSGIVLLRRTVHAAVAAWAETAGPREAAAGAPGRAAGYDQPVRIQGD